MLFFSPNKLKAYISLVNKMHDVFLEAGDGSLQIIIVYLLPPRAPVLRLGYRVFYNSPVEKARELTAPIYELEPTYTIGSVTNYTRTTEAPLYIEFPVFERYAASSTHIDYPLNKTLILNVFEKF